jgi:hypothetical protein
VAYLLKARTVEPEKQPLLAKGSEIIFVSRQRLGQHFPAATDTHATEEQCFLRGPYRGVIRKTIGAFCTGVCEEKSSVGREPPLREDFSQKVAIVRSRYQETLVYVL